MYKLINNKEFYEDCYIPLILGVYGLSELSVYLTNDLLFSKIIKLFKCRVRCYRQFTIYIDDDNKIIIAYNADNNEYFVSENNMVYYKDEFERYLRLIPFR
jgi:hypothetical protein